MTSAFAHLSVALGCDKENVSRIPRRGAPLTPLRSRYLPRRPPKSAREASVPRFPPDVPRVARCSRDLSVSSQTPAFHLSAGWVGSVTRTCCIFFIRSPPEGSDCAHAWAITLKATNERTRRTATHRHRPQADKGEGVEDRVTEENRRWAVITQCGARVMYHGAARLKPM